jgi:hypothetical protein
LSNPDNLDQDSPYLAAMRDRYKINNLVGFGSETTNKIEWCPTNVCNVRMRLDANGDLKCQECGLTITKTQQQQQQDKTKLNLKQNNGPTTPIVISQKSKGRDKRKWDTPNNELSDEDLDDLCRMGFTI